MSNKRFMTVLGLAAVVGMIIYPDKCTASAQQSMRLCAAAIIPALLPFFICIRILGKSGFSKKIGKSLSFIMRPAFNVPGEAAFAFVMGICSGYPMGAVCAADMYKNGRCTKDEAQRIIGFCNNSGPMFVMGSVGAVMLKSKTAGIILFFAHLLSAVTIGLIMGRKKGAEHACLNKTEHKDTSSILSSAVSESVSLIFYVCAYIIFFNIIVCIMDESGIFAPVCKIAKLFGFNPGAVHALMCGVIEMTGGIAKLCALDINTIKLPLISLLMGFGGISVILQIGGIITEYGLSIKKLILSKLMQSVIAFLYTYILMLIPVSVKTSSVPFSPLGSIMCCIMLIPVSLAVICAAGALFKAAAYLIKLSHGRI